MKEVSPESFVVLTTPIESPTSADMSGILKHHPTAPAKVVGVGILVVAMWAVAFFIPTPSQDRRLTVAASMWPGAEPFILAREAGELPPSKVNLVEINWDSAAMRAVGNRVVDVALLSLDEVVRQVGQGYPLKIVWVSDISQGADSIVARPEIREISQLRGLRVGYEPRTAAAVMLRRALATAGLTLAQIEQLPLNPAEAEEIFKELTLDAVSISEPWRHRLTPMGLNVLYDSSLPGAEVIRVLAVHKEALKRNKESVKLLIQAHMKWMPRLASLHAELEPVLRREGLTRQAFQDIIADLEVPTFEQNLKWLTGQNGRILNAMEAIVADLAAEEAGFARPDLAAVLDAELLMEIK